MDIGIFDHLDRGGKTDPQFYEERIRIARAFEAAGFYSYHVAEHHFTSLGMAPSPTLAGLFMRAVGYRQFRRYGFSGERISAALAHELGHVTEIVPADALDAKVAEIVDAMLMSAPRFCRWIAMLLSPL